MTTVRLTMAQAVMRYLSAQRTVIDGDTVSLFAGVWGIFGHGNVAAIGEALYAERETLPTWRGHNEQALAHIAIAYAKANRRRRMMAVTSSIGPGATNMVTAAALAHVNRLPVLLLPGDVFANRRPDPVLQQVEDFGDGTVSANDSFRTVSRYYDRITRPEQILTALPRALSVLTDPAECGPVTLSMCQDVQGEAFDYPESFFAARTWTPRRQRPDHGELAVAAKLIAEAEHPLIIAGGGALYSGADDALKTLVERHNVPLAVTQSGKGVVPDDHPLNMGAIGVTGTSAANTLAEKADVIVAVGTRLQDFTTSSWSLFKNPARRFVSLNVQPFDAGKHHAAPLIADARVGIEELGSALAAYRAPDAWVTAAADAKQSWNADSEAALAPAGNTLPSDAQVIGAIQRTRVEETVVVAAAGSLPGELHKHWRATVGGSYHLEYGFSTMGYEIAAGIGVKMAKPDADVIVTVGDGSYLMMNSEIATSVMLGKKITIVVLDNRGFGCINRLQGATGSVNHNNLLASSVHEQLPNIDFRAHAESLGAIAHKLDNLGELETALAEARTNDRTTVLVLDTDPNIATEAGGAWWDVGVPEVSELADVRDAHETWAAARRDQRLGD